MLPLHKGFDDTPFLDTPKNWNAGMQKYRRRKSGNLRDKTRLPDQRCYGNHRCDLRPEPGIAFC
jgi:hypothetical protein